MAGQVLQVNMDELLSAASATRGDIATISDTLSDGARAVSNTEAGPWVGPAGDALRGSMQQFISTQNILTDRLRKWADFLEWAANEYEAAEEKITSLAGTINDYEIGVDKPILEWNPVLAPKDFPQIVSPAQFTTVGTSTNEDTGGQ